MAEPPPARPGTAVSASRYRDALVVLLTLSTGAVDAVTYLRLGKVFSSVITGNLALLGVAAGQGDARLARNGGLALAGYGFGVLLGSPIARTAERDQPVWPMRVTVTLLAEFAVLAAFGGLWLASGNHRGLAARLALLLLAAIAMGMRSTAVRRLGQMSSTYLTSTLTGVLQALAVRRLPSQWQRSSGVLLAMVAGAALGALAVIRSPAWVPAAILAPLAAVIVCSLTVPERRRCRLQHAYERHAYEFEGRFRSGSGASGDVLCVAREVRPAGRHTAMHALRTRTYMPRVTAPRPAASRTAAPASRARPCRTRLAGERACSWLVIASPA